MENGKVLKVPQTFTGLSIRLDKLHGEANLPLRMLPTACASTLTMAFGKEVPTSTGFVLHQGKLSREPNMPSSRLERRRFITNNVNSARFLRTLQQ